MHLDSRQSAEAAYQNAVLAFVWLTVFVPCEHQRAAAKEFQWLEACVLRVPVVPMTQAA